MRQSESSFIFSNEAAALTAVTASLSIFCQETGWRYFNPISFDRTRNSRNEIVFATFSVHHRPNTFLVEVLVQATKVTIAWRNMGTTNDTFEDSIGLPQRIRQFEILLEEHFFNH